MAASLISVSAVPPNEGWFARRWQWDWRWSPLNRQCIQTKGSFPVVGIDSLGGLSMQHVTSMSTSSN